MKYDKIICINTCTHDSVYLEKLKQTPLYAKLKSNEAYKVIEVWGGFENTELVGDVLQIGCDESYMNLPTKMFEMFKFIYDNFDFSYIFKTDSTIMADTTQAKEHSLDKVSDYFDLPPKGHYVGLCNKHVKRFQLNHWAREKGINVDTCIIGRGHTLRFYHGKLYGVSREFTKYIAENSKEKLPNDFFTQAMEDLMPALMFEHFTKSKGLDLRDAFYGKT
jgi:hypothetical protein